MVAPVGRHCYAAGCGVDCHAINFQPFGVFVQTLRNTSLKLRGWPLISASIAARPVTSAVSPARRTLRSLQAALLYFVFPKRRQAREDPKQIAPSLFAKSRGVDNRSFPS